jgi:hypothetical protein
MPSILHISPEFVSEVPQLKANNNSWRAYRDKRTVIVFVHGVLSSALACWYNKEARTYWPDIVCGDEIFNECNVFLGGYYTAFGSTEFDFYQCAVSLLGQLKMKEEHPSVLDHERIIFVCHSLGGVVVRYMLTLDQTAFADKKIGLLLMASPSMGSEYAGILGDPIELLNHEIGRQLAIGSPSLKALDTMFSDYLQRRIVAGRALSGMEAVEQYLLEQRWYSWVVNRFSPNVVKEESAARYFRPGRRIPETTHSSIVKPNAGTHHSHRLLREFFQQRFEVQLPLTSASVAPLPVVAEVPLPPAAIQVAIEPGFRCSRLIWTITVNEDGDAPNDLIYERIVEAKNRAAYEFPLTPTWVHSGHMSRYEIDREKSMGLAGNLRGIVQPQLVQQIVEFDIPPSATQPQTVALHSIDFNVYSMDVEEFHRKETEHQDDIDYVQKKIRWEKVEELILDITFPANMRLRAGDAVSTRAYRIEVVSDTKYNELYDEDLTIKAKAGFAYDAAKRRATLRVQSPVAHTAYRILWALGPPVDVPKPAVVAIAQDNRRTLLGFRALFDGTTGNDPSGESKKAAVLNALAQFGAQVIAEVGRSKSEVKPDSKASVNLDQIDLSLMAVQKVGPPNEHEVLRVVAGLNVPKPYWELELAMGDGIAGRAAKIAGRDDSIQFRKFRRGAEGSMYNDAYLNFQGDGPQHLWLLSIPLHEKCCDPMCYGVLNIGAYDRHNADELDSLNDRSIEVLEKYSNNEFLRAVLNAVG